MKKLFTAAALTLGMAAALPAQADSATLGCVANDGSHEFKLTFDAATNKARLEGKIDVPQLNSSLTLAPVTNVQNDPHFQIMSLTVTTPSASDNGTVGGTMVTEKSVSAEFDMGSKNYVKVYVFGATSTVEIITCPVPGRAPAYD